MIGFVFWFFIYANYKLRKDNWITVKILAYCKSHCIFSIIGSLFIKDDLCDVSNFINWKGFSILQRMKMTLDSKQKNIISDSEILRYSIIVNISIHFGKNGILKTLSPNFRCNWICRNKSRELNISFFIHQLRIEVMKFVLFFVDQ